VLTHADALQETTECEQLAKTIKKEHMQAFNTDICTFVNNYSLESTIDASTSGISPSSLCLLSAACQRRTEVAPSVSHPEYMRIAATPPWLSLFSFFSPLSTSPFPLFHLVYFY
jgi:hypothetical protein